MVTEEVSTAEAVIIGGAALFNMLETFGADESTIFVF